VSDSNKRIFRIAIGRRKTDNAPHLLAGKLVGFDYEVLDTLRLGEDTYQLLQRDIKKAEEGDEC
jgi:FKBP-type peptidyl-prolyl cis-trans isomerase 2